MNIYEYIELIFKTFINIYLRNNSDWVGFHFRWWRNEVWRCSFVRMVYWFDLTYYQLSVTGKMTRNYDENIYFYLVYLNKTNKKSKHLKHANIYSFTTFKFTGINWWNFLCFSLDCWAWRLEFVWNWWTWTRSARWSVF